MLKEKIQESKHKVMRKKKKTDYSSKAEEKKKEEPEDGDIARGKGELKTVR